MGSDPPKDRQRARVVMPPAAAVSYALPFKAGTSHRDVVR